MPDVEREPEVLFALPCDDIRQEMSGKFLIIGAYSEAIVPAVLPTPLSLSFLISMRIREAGAYTLRISLLVQPGEQVVGRFAMNFTTVTSGGQVSIPVPATQFLIGQPGALILRAGHDDVEVMRIPINPASNVSPPPFSQSPFVAPAS